MALKHVLLGLLAVIGPRTGYGLHKAFFYPGRPTLPQIYHTLRDLKEEKLTEYERVYGQKEPSKNVFRVTESGYAELDRWLKRTDDDVVPMREALFIRTWFGSMIEKEEMIDCLKKYAEKRKAEMKYYDEQRKRILVDVSKKPLSPQDRFYWSLAFDYIATKLKADMDFTDHAIQQLLDTEVELSGNGEKKNKDNGKVKPSPFSSTGK